MHKLSLIIPVYNVEKYIAGCIESILSQCENQPYLEIIIVNDGSLDSSMDIVRSFDWHGWDVKIIDQPNGGLSSARNAGINASCGDYVWFIDSDDELEPNCIRDISQLFRYQYDAIAFNMLKIDEITREEVLEKLSDSSTGNTICNGESYLLNNNQIAPAQRFIYSRSLIGVDRFKLNIYHEDVEFNVRVLINAHRIYLSESSPYRYLVRSMGSITSTPNIKRSFDLLEVSSSFMNAAKQTSFVRKKILSRAAAFVMRQSSRLATTHAPANCQLKLLSCHIKLSLRWILQHPITILFSDRALYYMISSIFTLLSGILKAKYFKRTAMAPR